MQYKFKSRQVKGKGRGKLLGFPTINMEIPPDFKLPEGIYAVKVFISGQEFIGALHFGPVPTFNEKAQALEVFLINTSAYKLPETINLDIEVETIKYLRVIRDFPTEQALVEQINKDVEDTKKVTGLSF